MYASSYLHKQGDDAQSAAISCLDVRCVQECSAGIVKEAALAIEPICGPALQVGLVDDSSWPGPQSSPFASLRIICRDTEHKIKLLIRQADRQQRLAPSAVFKVGNMKKLHDMPPTDAASSHTFNVNICGVWLSWQLSVMYSLHPPPTVGCKPFSLVRP